MPVGPALLDTDTLSEISRRFTISAITVFERLRGYRSAIAVGRPFQRQLQAFEGLVQACVVLPVDEMAADVAATIWSGSARKARQGLGDLLIAAVAVARQLPLVTRNRRDFEAFAKVSGTRLSLIDWTKPASRKS
jgi:predicted nucleic acid-binding protein